MTCSSFNILRNLLVLYVLLVATSAATPFSIAKKDCRDRCGNVSIPYPFGIGSSHCYHEKAFEIRCNDSHNPPLPSQRYYLYENYEVLQLTEEYLRINVSVPVNCYNETTGQLADDPDVPLELSPILFQTPFTFSNTRNKFTVLGCNIFARIRVPGNNTFNGCRTFCDEIGYVGIPSLCVGNGCCQTTIPKGLKFFSPQVSPINIYKSASSLSPYYPCSHVFLADQEFSGIDDLILSREDSYVPLIMDWAIQGFNTCKDAQRNSSYVCSENSYCVDSQNGPGYNCKCLKGYRGNPYFPHGCQDVNECEEQPNMNLCEGKCTNTEGSFYCSCPSGYSGDGRKDGYGCVKVKRKVPLVAVVLPLGIGISLVLILLLVLGFWMYRRLEKRKKKIIKQNHFKRNGGMLLKQKISSNDGRVEKAAKLFVTEELEKATDNFNQSRIIGKGGFGTVYKGMLPDGRIVAIKKSKVVDESQVDQFINEVVILSQINHRHIVKLLGCCLETQVPLLVYEFVSNGTLSHHIHGECSITWKGRLRIAAEIAGALAYLHSDAAIPIFHRDIKSCNILLDDNYRAKVSDFGISRSIPLEKTHLTTLVQGTFGYLDPEYFHSSQFTEKSDVYSFGVVLVELLTGEKAISLVRFEEPKSLVMHFISSMKENRLFEILKDQVVVNEGDKDEILVVAKLAKRCLKLNGRKRPTMKEIAANLDGLRNFKNQPWVDRNTLQEEEEDCLIGDEMSSYNSNYASSTIV